MLARWATGMCAQAQFHQSVEAHPLGCVRGGANDEGRPAECRRDGADGCRLAGLAGPASMAAATQSAPADGAVTDVDQRHRPADHSPSEPAPDLRGRRKPINPLVGATRPAAHAGRRLSGSLVESDRTTDGRLHLRPLQGVLAFGPLARGLAEGVGFEPTVALATAVFKTAAIVHSATPPQAAIVSPHDLTPSTGAVSSVTGPVLRNR